MSLSKDEQEKIRKRINKLAKKKKEAELTAEEEAERQDLHQQFLANFREGFRQQLESIKVVDKEGNDITSEKAKKAQRKNGLRKD